MGLALGIAAGATVVAFASFGYLKSSSARAPVLFQTSVSLGILIMALILVAGKFLPVYLTTALLVPFAGIQSFGFNRLLDQDHSGVVSLLVCNGLGFSLGVCFFNLGFVFFGFYFSIVMTCLAYLLVMFMLRLRI